MLLKIAGKENKSIPNNLPWKTIVPHIDILNIPFMYRKLLSNRFNDVLGLHKIDHISIEIVNPDLTWISLSSTPSMLHNLMESGLWMYDGSISPLFYENSPFYTWHKTYRPEKQKYLRKTKEHAYNLRYGFCLSRKINNFHIIYSFATKCLLDDYYEFYKTKFNDLLKIGDYCHKQLRYIYQETCQKHTLPALYKFVPFQPKVLNKIEESTANHFLTLIVNNVRNKKNE